MILEVLTVAPDMLAHASSGAVSAANHLVNIAAVKGEATGTSWNWSWEPHRTLQEWSRKAAFIIGVIWVFYILFQFVMPKKGNTRGVGVGKIIIVLGLIIVLCNLKLIPDIINLAGKALYVVLNSLGLIKESY